MYIIILIYVNKFKLYFYSFHSIDFSSPSAIRKNKKIFKWVKNKVREAMVTKYYDP